MCSGGRRIVVVGSGFDLIQRATMKVIPSTDEFSQDAAPVEVRLCLCLLQVAPERRAPAAAADVGSLFKAALHFLYLLLICVCVSSSSAFCLLLLQIQFSLSQLSFSNHLFCFAFILY